MAEVKAAVLDAGNCAVVPGLLRDVIVEQRLDGLELALMDPSADRLDAMAGVGRRMARQSGARIRISTHAGRESALEGADLVFCAGEADDRGRFEQDRRLIGQHDPGHRVSELGGVAGMSCSLRQIARVQGIAADMRRLCPNAWLFMLAQPLSRVCQAAHEEGIRTVGFCSQSLEAFSLAWQLLEGGELRYPFMPARSAMDLSVAGVDGCAWLVECRDARTGRDLYPGLRKAARERPLALHPLAQRLLDQTGFLPVSGEQRLGDLLSSAGGAAGQPPRRQDRLELLRRVAEGNADWGELMEPPAWERPADLLTCMLRDQTCRFHTLNLINRAQISSLPQNIFVETPAVGTRVGPLGMKVDLPAQLAEICGRAAALTDALVRAARQRSRLLLAEAVELDPTIVDKKLGAAALAACMEAHRDVLPEYR